MKIKGIKTGKFAHPEPCKPIIMIVTGEIIDVDEVMAKALINTGWGTSDVATISLVDMSKQEIRDYADSIGLTNLNTRLTKAEMIEAIEGRHE